MRRPMRGPPTRGACRVSWFVTLAVAGCSAGGATPATQSVQALPDRASVEGHAPTLPAPALAGRWATVQLGGDKTVVAPGGARIATGGQDTSSQAQGIAVLRANGPQRGKLELFFAVGPAVVVAWLDAARCLAWSSKSAKAFVLDVERGAVTEVESQTSPVLDRARSLVVTVDATSRPRVLDAATLATRATIEVDLGDVKLGHAPRISLEAHESLILISDESSSVVATLAGEVRQSVDLGARPGRSVRLSPSGRYLAGWRWNDAGVAASILDVASGKRIHEGARGAYLDAVAFAPDESFAVVAATPADATVVALPSGRTRRMRDAASFYASGPVTYSVDRLGVTPDGHYLCGHPASPYEHTACSDELLFDLRTSRAVSRAPGYRECYVQDGMATLVQLPGGIGGPFSADSHVMPSIEATHTFICNRAMSPDRSVVAIVEDRDAERPGFTPPDAGMLHLLAIDVQNGARLHRFALEGEADGDATLSSSFSPGGRYVDVAWPGGAAVYDLRVGSKVGDGRATWLDDDAYFLLRGEVYSAAEGRAFPIDGASSPAQTPAVCLGGARVVAAAQCGAPPAMRADAAGPSR